MKFTIKVLKSYFAIFAIATILFSQTTTLHTKLRRTKSKTVTGSNRMAKLSEPVTNTIDLQTAKNFRDLAGLGYVETNSATEQISEIRKGDEMDKTKVSSLFKILFQQQEWEHIVTKTYGSDTFNYCFTIIRNLRYKKMVFTFTGTKGSIELLYELKGSGGLAYKKGKEYIKIMKYFFELYNKIKNDLKKYYDENKNKQISQYIFVGHSLGGAMASVSLFDFMQENLIPKTDISPVLITYGQPRTGNYAFANEIIKTVPIIFRFYNNYDPVQAVPACYTENGRCISEFGMKELNKSLNYKKKYKNLSAEEKNKFYPFHFSGLIFIKNDDISIDCREKSEVASDDICKGEISTSVKYHTNYFGYQIGLIGNPKEFPYGKSPPRKNKRHETFEHDKKKTSLWKEDKDDTYFNRAKNAANKVTNYLSYMTGLAHTKKLKK